MTKAEINAIIKESNQNRHIHWKVEENKKNRIVITNDYDNSIRFTIEKRDEQFWGGEVGCIEVYDYHMKHEIAYLLQGHRGEPFYCDFEDERAGWTMAIKKMVRHFYYYY